MSKIKYITCALASLLLSCEEHFDKDQAVVQVEFSTQATSSKAYGGVWSEADRIGIFMLRSGSNFTRENIVADASNIEHLASGSGAHCYFTPSDKTQTILMPQNDTQVDFCSYYPYTEVIYSGFNVPINVQDQSNLEAIDYMLSKRVTGKNQSDNKVLLTFDHILSLLEINLQGGYGTTRAELEDLSVTLRNSKSYGSLSIAQRTVSARNIGDVVTQKAGVDLRIEAIVIPQHFDASNYASLNVVHHGITYEIPLKFDFIQSKRHQITLLVEDRKIYLAQQDVVIKGWDAGTGGSYDFDHKVVADGTKELDKTIFTLDNPHWVVRGIKDGNINQNYTVVENIREALDALPTDGSANGRIVLEIEHITELPNFDILGVDKGTFEQYLQLKEVILSSSIKTLDNKTFAGCSNLQKITAVGVTTTAESVFEQCASLTQVDLPVMQTAGNYSFKNCSSLPRASSPQLMALSVELFAGCSSLECLSTPKAMKLYERALSGCNTLTELLLHANGEIKMLVNPFSGFTNSQQCILTLNTDKQQGGVGSPLITMDGRWGPLSKELPWKQIKFE